MIVRDVAGAAEREFDLLIAGGGIYGVSLLYEAARQGLSACLCEAHDFGGGTSRHSLRILHGGLRYLQTMDLRRFMQSVAARRSVARRFPGLVRPLRCLMPLYGGGLKRPSALRAALALNDMLSVGRNRGVRLDVRIGPSEVLDADATRHAFPLVRSDGLLGAAAWSDYFMVSSERVLIELLRGACREGATALNYVRVDELLVQGGEVGGVRVTDTLSDARHTVHARRVVNCMGPTATELARGYGGDTDALFRPSLAFNVLLEATLPNDSAVAVAAPTTGASTLFLVPQERTVLAGTMHLPRPAGTRVAEPTRSELESYLAHLRAAVPGFDIGLRHVRRVFAGLLPVRVGGTVDLVKREVVLDHGRAGGPRGFYSVSGVKYTTAVDVARQVIARLGLRASRAAPPPDEEIPTVAATNLLIDARQLWANGTGAIRQALYDTVREEAVQSAEDLIFGRTNWATTEPDLDLIRTRLAAIGVDFDPAEAGSQATSRRAARPSTRGEP
jgi:glycerol-3-phosphate dehydrogenase